MAEFTNEYIAKQTADLMDLTEDDQYTDCEANINQPLLSDCSGDTVDLNTKNLEETVSLVQKELNFPDLDDDGKLFLFFNSLESVAQDTGKTEVEIAKIFGLNILSPGTPDNPTEYIVTKDIQEMFGQIKGVLKKKFSEIKTTYEQSLQKGSDNAYFNKALKYINTTLNPVLNNRSNTPAEIASIAKAVNRGELESAYGYKVSTAQGEKSIGMIAYALLEKIKIAKNRARLKVDN